VLLAIPIGCKPGLSDDECGRLLDHYVTLLMREEQPEAGPMEIVRKQLEARRAARQDARYEFGSCSGKVSRRQFDCAMAAPNVDAVERCLLL
jgi:hypothetical protein